MNLRACSIVLACVLIICLIGCNNIVNSDEEKGVLNLDFRNIEEAVIFVRNGNNGKEVLFSPETEKEIKNEISDLLSERNCWTYEKNESGGYSYGITVSTKDTNDDLTLTLLVSESYVSLFMDGKKYCKSGENHLYVLLKTEDTNH